MTLGLNAILLDEALSKKLLDIMVVTTHTSNACNQERQEASKNADKIRQSCERCREVKSRCDGRRPCEKCIETYKDLGRNEIEKIFHYGPVQKPGPKTSSATKEVKAETKSPHTTSHQEQMQDPRERMGTQQHFHKIMMGQMGMPDADPWIIPQNTTPGFTYWTNQATRGTYPQTIMIPPGIVWDNPLVLSGSRTLFPATAKPTNDRKHDKKAEIQKAFLMHLLALHCHHQTAQTDLEMDLRNQESSKEEEWEE
eukprot:jgi/Psemu1/291438/fgenesh1_pg.699_\